MVNANIVYFFLQDNANIVSIMLVLGLEFSTFYHSTPHSSRQTYIIDLDVVWLTYNMYLEIGYAARVSTI